jgi:hypothetical protein
MFCYLLEAVPHFHPHQIKCLIESLNVFHWILTFVTSGNAFLCDHIRCNVTLNVVRGPHKWTSVYFKSEVLHYLCWYSLLGDRTTEGVLHTALESYFHNVLSCMYVSRQVCMYVCMYVWFDDFEQYMNERESAISWWWTNGDEMSSQKKVRDWDI